MVHKIKAQELTATSFDFDSSWGGLVVIDEEEYRLYLT